MFFFATQGGTYVPTQLTAYKYEDLYSLPIVGVTFNSAALLTTLTSAYGSDAYLEACMIEPNYGNLG